MKKIILSSLVAVTAATTANAGVYISPKVSWNWVSVDESRTEKKWNGTDWAYSANNKHESWSDRDNKLSPKIAVGYDFDMEKYGILSIEAEYGKTSNHFNPLNGYVDESGSTPNDTDTRTFTYRESTLSLNAKYGYEIYNVIPFVTAGIGYTVIDSENNFRSGKFWWDTTDQEKNLSWNVGAGIEVPVAEKISLTLSYLYTNLGDVKYSNWMYGVYANGAQTGIKNHFDSDVDLEKHEVVAGVKIQF